MEKTLRELASFVQGTVEGDENVVIKGVSGIKEARPGDITFVANPKYVPLMNHTQASAIIVAHDIETNTDRPLVRTENPSLAFAKVVSLFAPNEVILPKGIHPTAVVGKDVRLEKNVALGPHVVIEDNVEIGDGSVLYAGVYVGHHTRIGGNCLIYPNVSIRERITIGKRVIIHSGTVIGSDGFGFATVRGVHHRIPQIGTVVIEDDVEIGSNVTIDRARFDRTWIKRGTKIDNLVQIAHNVVIGEDTIVVAQTGISGSTTIGNNVILAGQSGVIGHIEVGDNVVVGAQAGVTKSVPPGTIVSGYPAKPHQTAKRINACIQKLPIFYKLIKEMQAKLEQLEERWKNREQ